MALAAGTGTEHRYQLCRDVDCERFPCRVYKEGRRDGYEAGWHAGYAAGYTDGYRAGYDDGYKHGFADGIEACTRPHQ
jgi:hypothetical protein